LVKKIVLEIAQFRLRAGVSEKDFLKVSDRLQKDYLVKQKGYVDRELVKREDGLWSDILHWSNMEDAKRVGENIMTADAAQNFLKMLDPDSVVVMYFEQVQVYGK
jgi:hypothetical protein